VGINVRFVDPADPEAFPRAYYVTVRSGQAASGLLIQNLCWPGASKRKKPQPAIIRCV
jgi:hypothetical protein